MWTSIKTFLKMLFVPTNDSINQIDESENSRGIPGAFSTDMFDQESNIKGAQLINTILKNVIVKKASDFRYVPNGAAMDSIETDTLGRGYLQPIPDIQVSWYASQGFLGYQLCAIISQNWLVNKACAMPARDAVRNGYEITINDGSDIGPEILQAIRQADVVFRLNKNLVNFVRMGRVFGIRIAMFIIDNNDPDFYFKPFNIDGVRPGSYKGISQIDPYWVSPELDEEAVSDPTSIHFYEPTYWRVGSRRIHRSHLIIFRGDEVADVLKPTYFYGGLSVPQKVFERVYAAERTANEAPLLSLTKRSTIINTDLAQIAANQKGADNRFLAWVRHRTNFGLNILGEKDKAQQFDTSLTDLDAVIMTQYQIVAGASNVPVVKLLGTSPKGFNATGEHEEASYHEELKSIQTSDLTPLIERHHVLLIKSKIAPQFNIQPFETVVVWNPLGRVTAKEQSEINKLKADTDVALVSSGAIDPDDVRRRVINDPSSGYNGLIDADESRVDDEEATEESQTV